MLALGEVLHARLSGAAADVGSTLVWQRCVPGVCTTVAGEQTGDYRLTAPDAHLDPSGGDPSRWSAADADNNRGGGTLAGASPVPAVPVNPFVAADAGPLSIVLAATPPHS